MPDSNRPGWFSLRGAAFGLALSVAAGGFLLLETRRAPPGGPGEPEATREGGPRGLGTPAVGGPAVYAAPQAMPVANDKALPAGIRAVPPALADLPPGDLARAARLVACLLRWEQPAQADALAEGVTRVEAREGLRLLIVELLAAGPGPDPVAATPAGDPALEPPPPARAPGAVPNPGPAAPAHCTAKPGGLDDRDLEAALAIVGHIGDPATRADALLALAERTPGRLAGRILDAKPYGELAAFVAAQLSRPPGPPPALMSYPGQSLVEVLVEELSREDAKRAARGTSLAERQRALLAAADRLYRELIVREEPPPVPPASGPAIQAFVSSVRPPLPVSSGPPTSVGSLVEAAIAKTQAAQVHAEEEQEASRKALSEWGRGLLLTGVPPIVGALAPALGARLVAGRGRRRAGA